MPFTWKDLKDAVRNELWPSGESPNLSAAHDKHFVDGMIDLQTFVDCLQQDNTSLFPQCSTFYNCGLTVIDVAPRGIIRRVSVIDKVNPDTHKEDATAADDWCSEIAYNEVDYCHVRSFLDQSTRRGCCMSIPLFFGLAGCTKARFPVPTDAGLPPGLPKLDLGYHYPQTSTDRVHGRAQHGIWAKQRGQIFIAPWIQSTETVVVVWDGIKRQFSDGDPVDDDPLLSEALREWVRWKHADIYDHDPAEAAAALAAYAGNPALGIIGAREKLVHQCREETRVRNCEPSHARQVIVTNLFFNDQQSASAACPDGTTGSPVSVVIAAGTVSSAISKADANQRAKDEALSQAQAQLVCTPNVVTYTNDAQTATAQCQGGENYTAEGTPVSSTVPAGTITSTVSKADANAQALAQAQAQANAQLVCTYWNSAQSYQATCSDASLGTNITVPAHTWSSTISGADANDKAIADAKAQSESTCPVVFKNTAQTATASVRCFNAITRQNCTVTVNTTVEANKVSSTVSQADANQKALSQAQLVAFATAESYCAQGICGTFNVKWPTNPGQGPST